MSTFESVADIQDHLIRKAKKGALFVAPYSAALPTKATLFANDGTLAPWNPVYESLGKLSTDGAEASNEQEITDIFGWGDTSGPARRDVERQTRSLNVTAIETRRKVLEVFDNVELGAENLAKGGLEYDAPAEPVIRERRSMLLTADRELAAGLPIYMALVYPRSVYTVNGSQTLAGGENPLNWPMTLTGLVDPVVGTSFRRIWGGPGWNALAEDMGFEITP